MFCYLSIHFEIECTACSYEIQRMKSQAERKNASRMLALLAKLAILPIYYFSRAVGWRQEGVGDGEFSISGVLAESSGLPA